MSERGVATVTIDVADVIAIRQMMCALHELLHAPADVDAHAALMASRGLSLSMMRRLSALQTGPVVRASEIVR